MVGLCSVHTISETCFFQAKNSQYGWVRGCRGAALNCYIQRNLAQTISKVDNNSFPFLISTTAGIEPLTSR